LILSTIGCPSDDIMKLFCLLRHKQYCSACVAVRQLLDW